MKIKIKEASYSEVLQKKQKKFKPKKPNPLLVKLVKFLSKKDLKDVNFTYQEIDMDKISKTEPILILMNHSSFIDTKIAYKMLKKRKFHIVCTDDGFVGKASLLKNLGCIPTYKFINDLALVKNMQYAFQTLKDSVLLFPEASYSFDGTKTELPESLYKAIKLFSVPVVMIKTEGAFLRDPLYNNLQLRKINVSAYIKCLLTKEEIEKKDLKEIQKIVDKEFSFDNFLTQKEKQIKITEDFRADHLNRVLYKCASCEKEGMMEGKNTKLICKNCKKEYELTETGYLKALDGNTVFDHIPTWYLWQREKVKEEILNKTYYEKMDVDIYTLVDLKCLYKVGTGTLTHSLEGFTLKGLDGMLDFKKEPKESYSLYSDFYWYELGDVVCIGNTKIRYYCIPKNKKDIVAKLRLATEELYKLNKN